MYGIRSLQNGGAPKKLGKAEKYIPPELRPQAGALVDLIKWIKSNPYRAARDVAESFGPQADITGMVDSAQGAMENLREGNIGAGLTDMAYVPANMATLFLPGSASGMRRAAEGLGGGVGKKADDLPMDEASRMEVPRMRRDNPGDEWLSRKIEEAAEKRATSGEFTVGGTLGGVDGVTGYFNDYLRMRPEALRDIKGAMGEERFAGGEKLQRLRESIEREGYRDDSPISIAVREDGTPFVLEGNTRIQEAIESGRPSIQVELKYLRGAEDVDGPLSPDKLPDFLAPDDLRASERAQEAIRGQADPIEQVAKESYASE
jgi:hypothetical protein